MSQNTSGAARSAPSGQIQLSVAGKPGFLHDLIRLMSRHNYPENQIERIRRRAIAMRAATEKPLTADSDVDELVAHGVDTFTANALKNNGMSTVGAVCERTADDLRDIVGIETRRLAQLSGTLAKFFMGLRPNQPPK